jgi:hypothetical protein
MQNAPLQTSHCAGYCAARLDFIVATGATSLKSLQVLTADVSGSGSGAKNITSVVYNLKAFPANGGVETVEICYSRPYSSSIGNCVAVVPGSSGSLTNFNSLTFGAGAAVWVRHIMNGGTYPATAPSTPDVITINWKY